MKRVLMTWGMVIIAGMTWSGCVTQGANLETTFQDIHRRVAKLEKSADASIAKLDETATALSTKVSDNTEQANQLRAAMETNKAKMTALIKEAKAIKEAIYRAQGITVVPRAGTVVTPGAAAPGTSVTPPETPEKPAR